jgi:type I restriction enzyme S subunit
MSELPPGWYQTTVGSIFTVVGGGTPDTARSDFWSGTIPWITSADVSDRGAIAVRRAITEEAIRSSATSVVPADSVIVVTRVGLGKVARATQPIAFSQDCQALLPADGIDAEFLRLQLSKTAQVLRHQSRGTTISGVTKKQLLDLPLVIPPTAEQRRIVAAIEEEFSRLDAAVAALERVRQNLKRYRRALQGTLAGSAPAGVEALRPGWRSTTIGEICECLDNRRVPVNKLDRLNRVGFIPYYGANGQVGSIDDHLFDEPLVLVVEDETFTGREKPFSYKISGKSWVNNHAHVLRPKPGTNIDFLNRALAYYPFTPLTTGTTGRRKLTKAALMSAPITIPDEGLQTALAIGIETHLELAARLESEAGIQLARTLACRSSILSAALSGNLVPQDPTDERAIVLLERIADKRAYSNGVRANGRRPRTTRQRVTA